MAERQEVRSWRGEEVCDTGDMERVCEVLYQEGFAIPIKEFVSIFVQGIEKYCDINFLKMPRRWTMTINGKEIRDYTIKINGGYTHLQTRDDHVFRGREDTLRHYLDI